MQSFFPLAPRYRLDDESPWLKGIDPTRHYWLAVNGDQAAIATLPGLLPESFEAFKNAILTFRTLQPGEVMPLVHIARHSTSTIHCISQNCYAIETEFQSALVWHLFDQETLDSLLMSAHPDWQCSSKDLELGRRMLQTSWSQPAAA